MDSSRFVVLCLGIPGSKGKAAPLSFCRFVFLILRNQPILQVGAQKKPRRAKRMAPRVIYKMFIGIT